MPAEESVPNVWVVVGLGNPGPKYDSTRHNVGFMVLEELVRRHTVSPRRRAAFSGEVCEAMVQGRKAMLLWPLTYMNKSGESVRLIKDFYKLAVPQLLVVCDDFQLPLGKLRVRVKGSSGGQKGLDDIIRKLQTDEVTRLRIGIGPVPPHWDPADFVLGRFNAEENEIIKGTVQAAADAVQTWIVSGSQTCMNLFN